MNFIVSKKNNNNAVHQSLASSRITSADERISGSEMDVLFVEVKISLVKLLIVAVYIPSFTLEHLYKDLVNLIEDVSSTYPSENVLLCGDLNITNILWHNNPIGYSVLQYVPPSVIGAANQLLQTAELMDWCQLFPSHSRKGFTLDLLFGSPSVCSYVPMSDSLVRGDPEHHESAFFKINGLCTEASECESENQPLKNYRLADYEMLSTLLDVDWDRLFECNVNESVNNFYSVLTEAIEKCVPDLKVRVSSYPAWYTNELKNLINEKKALHAIWKDTHLDIDYIEFSLIRAQCLRLSRVLYKKYLFTIESNIGRNIKSFWSYVHRFKNSSSLPPTMHLQDRSASCRRSICNLLAEHFQSVFSTQRLVLPPPKRLTEMLISMQIDEQELIAALSRLDDNIKSGPDGIPPYFIKRLKFPLLSPLLKLYNKSLSSGVFPDFWKESFIFPIHKDGDKSDVVNYRPISILSTFAKIFESIIAKRLAEYFLRSIGSFQHGFIKGRSTLTNLLLFNDFIFEAFLEKWQVDSIYIDFSKAFDRVNHGMLLRKLENAGIEVSLLKWLESYLSCRSQSVRSCGATSFKFSPTSGVPQGSNLGPLLFSVFINDLAEVVKLVKVLLYADDIKLLFLVRSERDAVTLQRELEGLLRWSVSNGLPINLSKCKVISFCVGECPFSTHYKLGNIELERVDQIRDLGVIMDKSLSFREQSQVVVKKCLRIFGFIRNVTIDFNNLFTISYLYKILLLPIITYCIPIWYPKTENSLKELILDQE